MSNKEFLKIVSELNYAVTVILKSKTEEYALDDNDRLKAFKRVWLKNSKENPREVLWNQMAKHLDSLYDYTKQDDKFNYNNIIKWKDKIVDTIIYLYLLYALAVESAILEAERIDDDELNKESENV